MSLSPVTPPPPANAQFVDARGRLTPTAIAYLQSLGGRVETAIMGGGAPGSGSTGGGSSGGTTPASEPGNVSAVFDNGAVVADGTYLLVPSAPYQFTITGLADSGTTGGAYVATIMVNGVAVPGLANVAVPSAAPHSAAPSTTTIVPAGGQVAVIIAGTTGAPTNSVLTLGFTRA